MNRVNSIWAFALLIVLLAACANAPQESPVFDEPMSKFTDSSAQANKQATLSVSSDNCLGDTNQPDIASGWKLLWQKTFEHPIARPPVVNGAQLFVIERSEVPSNTAQYRDTLWDLDPRTSDAQWRVGDPDAPRQLMRFMLSPKYVAGLVRKYNSSTEPGQLPISEYTSIIDRSSGRVVHDLEVSVEAISDEALYHRSFGRALNRIDLPSGTVSWYERDAAESWGSLFTKQGNLYAIGFDSMVYQYDAANGRLIATGALGKMSAVRDFVVQDDLVIIRSGQGFEGIAAFDLNTMTPRWKTAVSYPSLRRSTAFWDAQVTFTVTPEAVYVYDAENTLLSLDLRTGQVGWRNPAIEAEPMSPPVVADELVYGLFADGAVRAFSATDGSFVGTAIQVPIWYWNRMDSARDWRDRVGGLAVADNILFVTTGCRSVYAIQHNK